MKPRGEVRVTHALMRLAPRAPSLRQVRKDCSEFGHFQMRVIGGAQHMLAGRRSRAWHAEEQSEQYLVTKEMLPREKAAEEKCCVRHL